MMRDATLTNQELAERLYQAERQLDFDTILECENAICGRLQLPLDQTERGLTPWAAAQIDNFRDRYRQR